MLFLGMYWYIGIKIKGDDIMKLYEVKRHDDDVDYDEYDSLMVLAKSRKGALKHAIEFQSYFSEERVEVEEIKQDSEGIVHMSFIAG
jgi:hypothetical protein